MENVPPKKAKIPMSTTPVPFPHPKNSGEEKQEIDLDNVALRRLIVRERTKMKKTSGL